MIENVNFIGSTQIVHTNKLWVQASWKEIVHFLTSFDVTKRENEIGDKILWWKCCSKSGKKEARGNFKFLRK